MEIRLRHAVLDPDGLEINRKLGAALLREKGLESVGVSVPAGAAINVFGKL